MSLNCLKNLIFDSVITEMQTFLGTALVLGLKRAMVVDAVEEAALLENGSKGVVGLSFRIWN